MFSLIAQGFTELLRSRHTRSQSFSFLFRNAESTKVTKPNIPSGYFKYLKGNNETMPISMPFEVA